ncbi:MAG TPA: amidohydrolase family protein, partial [Terriglobales bacterium]|nr:amidohydrolase family protein [Terriglobales bacterium]
MNRFLVYSVLVAGVAFSQEQPAPPRADKIFVHANVYTGVAQGSAFKAIQRAQAIAVRGDRIQAVGDNGEILKLKGPQTQVIDLGGKFLMPGFNDAHVHLSEAGSQALNVDLAGVKSLEEFRARIRANAEKAVPGDWILGGGWDENLWPVKAVPTRWDVDEVAGDHPVFLERVDGHIAVASTRALQLASITIASRDPKGGKIDRDANGQPTGVLRETARQAVYSAIPAPTH